MTKSLALLLAATCVAAFSVPVVAADATGIDPTRPDTTPRIGGSPADAAFRAAQQESAADYRAARAACKAQPRAQRGSCLNDARAALKHTRLDASAAHAAAQKAR